MDENLDRTPSLLIAAHCSTIQRKAQRLEREELSAILDDFTRELNTNIPHPITYLSSLNQIVVNLNSNAPPILATLSSHYFFLLIRNTIRNLLQQLSQAKQLADEEIYLLRNCTLLINDIIQQIPDVSKILHWLAEVTFLDALAQCFHRIVSIAKRDSNGHVMKQIVRLLNLICIVQERLPIDSHQTLFVRLLQPTIDCLTSSSYVKAFANLRSNAESFTEKQKFFLLKCPYFLTTYNGPRIDKAMEQVLEVMLPRYVTILDKHIKTIQQWKRPIMRAVHNLIITIICAEGYFSSYTQSELFRSLIKHLLSILNQSTFIRKIQSNSNNIETLLIDSTLIVFNVLVYEANALDYIKQRKASSIFRQLTKVSNETIVLNAYMMLAYTTDDKDLQGSSDDLIRLFSTILNLLRKNVANNNGNVLPLLESLKGLVQYERIQKEIVQQDLVAFLINSCDKLQGLAKQILLECLWKLAFYEPIARQLREYRQFLNALEDLPKPGSDYTPSSSAYRRSSSFSNLQKSDSKISMETANYGIRKAADGLLWKLVKEPHFREKMKISNDHQQYQYDIMISYCHADKDIAQKIQQFLANEGLNIWSEHEHNNEQGMQIVAKAIENSEFVIICISDSYKRDNHCQAQAEYAMASKRILLPLIAHTGYKPDGWFNALIYNHIPIDFSTSNFKTASELLMKVIKQRQCKKEIPDLNRTITPSVNADRQQSWATHSTSRASMPASINTVAPISVFGQQQQPLLQPVSRSTTPGVTFPNIPTITIQQQQPLLQSVSRSTTPGVTFANIPTITIQQQQQPLLQPVSRPTTPGATFPNIPTATIQQQQQQQPLLQPVSRSTTPGVTFPNIPTTTIQQQQPLLQPISRSTTPGVTFPNIPTTTIQQQQQPLLQSLSRPLTPESTVSIGLGIGDKQQEQQTSMHSISRSAITDPTYSVVPMANNQQQQQITRKHSDSRSATTNFVYRAAPIVVNQQYQQQQTVPHSVARSSTPSPVSSDSSNTTGTERQQTTVNTNSGSFTHDSDAPVAPTRTDKQSQTSVRSVSRTTTPGSNVSAASIAQSLKQASPASATTTAAEQQTKFSTSSFISSDENQLDGKQPQKKLSTLSSSQISIAKPVLPAASNTTSQHQQQTPAQSNSIRSNASTIDDQQQWQQTSTHSILKSSIPSSADAKNQQRQALNFSSRSTTPGIVSNRSSTSLKQLSSLQLNTREKFLLPTKYTNRRTHDSIYRTLPIHAWRNNDVLDFLFDTHLYTMMPLCESMSGKALVRLFRMCHTKPSRLHDQLNEELRTRFKGLTLPMGVYTQFLIEMDALAGPVSDTIPSVPDSNPRILERVILTSRPSQQQQQQQQPIPRYYIPASTARSVDSMPETPNSRNPQVIYRVASNLGRPNGFHTDSVEEPTVLFDQLQRYANQFLILDERA